MAKKQKIIVGIDEVGRGPLAGPVMACAITVSHSTLRSPYDIPPYSFAPSRGMGRGIRNGARSKEWGGGKDSKKLSAKQREEVYNFLKKNPQVEWGIGKVGEKIIDRINIFQATKLAMQKAVFNLEKKIGQQAGMLLIDGNFGIEMARPQKSIIKGDEKVLLISLASIVAKVERDRLMIKMHGKYPQYGFNQHKGYGTKQHIAAIKKHGACNLHRFTFSKIKPEKFNLPAQLGKHLGC